MSASLKTKDNKEMPPYRVPRGGSLYFTKYDGSDNKEEEVASENQKTLATDH